jgi:multiple sugar transport system ATP-binding protein
MSTGRRPQAFLMDEPLSNLDAKLRVSRRTSLAELHARLVTTTVYVTHDQTEAMTLGQRVAVMRDGRVQQHDTPQVLYDRPANLFVASFMGSPAMNLVEARVGDNGVEFAGIELPFDRDVVPQAPAGETVVLGIRPEDFSTETASGLPSLEVEAVVVENLGADMHVVFTLDAPRVDVGQRGTADDDDAQLLADTHARFTARIAAHTQLQAGDRIRLAVDPARFASSIPTRARGSTPDNNVGRPLVGYATRVTPSLSSRHPRWRAFTAASSFSTGRPRPSRGSSASVAPRLRSVADRPV